MHRGKRRDAQTHRHGYIQVMLLKNRVRDVNLPAAQRLVNGSRGVVVGFVDAMEAAGWEENGFQAPAHWLMALEGKGEAEQNIKHTAEEAGQRGSEERLENVMARLSLAQEMEESCDCCEEQAGVANEMYPVV
ncbi:MAG: hypothetical protein ACPIOQ_32140, partial [Promethearchaeia archaeon]